jgi:hypothetical protein
MTDPHRPFLNTDALAALARQSRDHPPCAACAARDYSAWESVHAGFDAARLQVVGTLRQEGDEEPTFAEHHPHATHGSSADAPIAPAFFPYNRCEVWQCRVCGHAFLRYTEYGGYYQDPRIRSLNPGLIDDAALS